MKLNGAFSHVAKKAMEQESQAKELTSVLSTPKNGSCLPDCLCLRSKGHNILCLPESSIRSSHLPKELSCLSQQSLRSLLEFVEGLFSKPARASGLLFITSSVISEHSLSFLRKTNLETLQGHSLSLSLSVANDEKSVPKTN